MKTQLQIALWTLAAGQFASAQMNTNPVYSAGQMLGQTYGNSQAWFNAAEMRRKHAEGAPPTPDELQWERGNRVIKAGRATTLFRTRTWPVAYWMANTLKDTSVSAEEDRLVRSSGMEKQRAEFARQVKARGAKWGDMADMMAVATVIAVESYTGERVSDAGFQKQRQLARRAYLKDPFFQGRSVVSKQQFYEGQLLLGSTYSWWLRRVKNDVPAARASAASFFKEWYDLDGPAFTRVYAPYLGAVK